MLAGLTEQDRITLEISKTILEKWRIGDKILVTPGYQEKVFRYYLQYRLGRQDIAQSIPPVPLSDIIKYPDATFLVFVTSLPNSQESDFQAILGSSYQPDQIRVASFWLGQSLYIKR